jgi:hypothetical protein
MRTVLALVLLAGTSAAADKPNFSGDWAMDVAKSDFGGLPPPTSLTRKITHAEPSLTILEEQSSALGDQKTTRSYTTDGTEISFEANGAEVKSKATWADDTLVVISTVAAVGLKFDDKMTMSPDGKNLISAIHIDSPQGAVDIRVVFERHSPDRD